MLAYTRSFIDIAAAAAAAGDGSRPVQQTDDSADIEGFIFDTLKYAPTPPPRCAHTLTRTHAHKAEGTADGR